MSGLILHKQLEVQGFIVFRWLAEWPEAFKGMREWIDEASCCTLRRGKERTIKEGEREMPGERGWPPHSHVFHRVDSLKSA